MRNHYYFKTFSISVTIVFIRSVLDLNELTYFKYEHYTLKDSCVSFFKEYVKY